MSESTHILIVEDSPLYQYFLSHTLERDGYRTSSVSNGEAAIEYIKQKKPDLVILDLYLPDMTGFDVLEKMSAVVNPLIPVIVLTADEALENLNRSFEAGAVVYLEKSVSEEELVKSVALELKKHDTDKGFKAGEHPL